MTRHLLLIIVFALTSRTPAYAGYEVITLPQIPQYVTVRGGCDANAAAFDVIGNQDCTQQWVNPALKVLPPGVVCQPNGFARNLVNPALRTLVVKTDGNSSSNADLFSACPQIREYRKAEIRAEGDRRLKLLASPYMDGERETWANQMKEAEAYLFDPVNTQTPMLSAMAAARGITIPDLVGKVWENVTLFRQASGQILGLQQKLLDDIDKATDFAALLAIGWGN